MVRGNGVLSIVMNMIHGSYFFFQAEDGIRDLVRSRGLGDVYKRQVRFRSRSAAAGPSGHTRKGHAFTRLGIYDAPVDLAKVLGCCRCKWNCSKECTQ